MSKSDQLFEQARQTIPGGVNSPVRAFNGVGGTPASSITPMAPTSMTWMVRPMWITSDPGAPCCWATTTRPSRPPSSRRWKRAELRRADRDRSADGREGAPDRPSMEQVRMVNSGTEATMSAIRLARGYTGRDKIVKFEGCYHGHADSCWSRLAPAPLTLGQPTARAYPPISPNTRSPVCLTIWTRCAKPSPSTAARSPVSSSSR